VIDKRKESQIGKWLEKIAHTFEHIGREQSDSMGRLRRIASMTDIHSS
jgi:hypothetical protein